MQSSARISKASLCYILSSIKNATNLNVRPFCGYRQALELSESDVAATATATGTKWHVPSILPLILDILRPAVGRII